MKQSCLKILSNKKIAENVYEMLLGGEHGVTGCGQFVNIKLNNLFLRRPISVCDYSEDTVLIIYKVVGRGTEQMSLMKEGEILDVLSGLGNGYKTENAKSSALLIGGGAGVPPMYRLAKDLINQGKSVKVILGFNKACEVFYEDEFKKLGADVFVTTVDGSYGIKGFVTDAMDGIDYDYFYTCGPEPMLKAVYNNTNTTGEFSFEERMGCGFGACMGCSCKTKYGNKRICKDGPVLVKEEIIW